MTIDPEDEQVAAAFASLKAESSAHFPPPPVNELIMRGPAALRRRRLVSLAAVFGACTAVTAGGFAVAQTLGPLSGGPAPADNGTAGIVTSTADASPSFEIGDPESRPVGESDEDADTTAPDGEPVIEIEPAAWWADTPDAWGTYCESGPQPFDAESWTITGESGWKIMDPAQDPDITDATDHVHDYDRPLDLDADGDKDDVLLELGCDEVATGVAAFTWDEAGTGLHLLGWVWEPEGSSETVDIRLVADGVITLGGYDEKPETWQDRYRWDGEAFALLPDDAPDEPTPEETATSPAPSETPTAEDKGTTAGAEGGS